MKYYDIVIKKFSNVIFLPSFCESLIMDDQAKKSAMHFPSSVDSLADIVFVKFAMKVSVCAVLLSR